MGLGDPKYKKNHSYIIENFHGGDGYTRTNAPCVYKHGHLCTNETSEYYKKACKDFKCELFETFERNGKNYANSSDENINEITKITPKKSKKKKKKTNSLKKEKKSDSIIIRNQEYLDDYFNRKITSNMFHDRWQVKYEQNEYDSLIEEYSELKKRDNLSEIEMEQLKELNQEIQNYPETFLTDLDNCFIYKDLGLTIAESIARDAIIKLKDILLYPSDLIIHEIGFCATQKVNNMRSFILNEEVVDHYNILLCFGCTIKLDGVMNKSVVAEILGSFDIISDNWNIEKNYYHVGHIFQINNGKSTYTIGDQEKWINNIKVEKPVYKTIINLAHLEL